MKEHNHQDSLTKEVRKIDFWSWIRIGVVILLIVGAYTWGVIEWSRFTPKYGNGPMKYNRPLMEDYQKKWTQSPQKMDHNMTHDPMDMSMRDMGKMLEGKTGDALNKAFLEGMIPHHEWAVEMAKYLASSNKPELVKLGGEIIVAQTREIEQMKKWMVEWGYTTTGSSNTGTLSPEEVMMRDHCLEMPEMMGCEKYQ